MASILEEFLIEHRTKTAPKTVFQNYMDQHGVKGMKWGIRKSRDGSYKSTAQVLAEEKRSARRATFEQTLASGQKVKFNYNPRKYTLRSNSKGVEVLAKNKRNLREGIRQVQKEFEAAKRKPSVVPKKELDIADLRKAVDRLRLEQEYSRLNAPEKSKTTRFMEQAGSQIAMQATTKVGTEILSTIMKKTYNKAVPEGIRIITKK